MRFSAPAFLISAALGTGSMVPSRVGGQGRGARRATDNRPEGVFPVDVPADDARLTSLKNAATRLVDSMSIFTQQMVDMVFSFGELGMQEEETSKYLTGILEKNGFKVQRGFAGNLAQQGHHGQIPSGDAEVLLRSDEVQDVPRATRHQVPDGEDSTRIVP